MNFYDPLFYFFAVVTVVSAFVVVGTRNIAYSAFSLLFTFFGVAGLYVLLNADFIAVSQLLIYVGGILVLLLFGVMLTNRVVNVELKTGTLRMAPAAILVAVGGGSLAGILWVTDWKIVSSVSDVTTTTNTLGEMFMTTYLLPFEVISVVLLVALVGAALIARKDRPAAAAPARRVP